MLNLYLLNFTTHSACKILFILIRNNFSSSQQKLNITTLAKGAERYLNYFKLFSHNWINKWKCDSFQKQFVRNIAFA